MLTGSGADADAVALGERGRIAEIVQHPSQDLDASGQVVAEVPKKSFHMELDVIFENQQWVIREVSLERTDA